MTKFYDNVSFGTDDGFRDAMKGLLYDNIPVAGVWENGNRRYPLSPVWDGLQFRNGNSSFVYSWDFNENADTGETLFNTNEMFRGWYFDDDNGQANYLVDMSRFSAGPQFGSMQLAGNNFGRPPMWRWKVGLEARGIYNFYLSYRYREDNRATNGSTSFSLNPYIMLHDLSATNVNLPFSPTSSNPGCFILRHDGYDRQRMVISHTASSGNTTGLSGGNNSVSTFDGQNLTMRLVINFNDNSAFSIITNERNDWDQSRGTALDILGPSPFGFPTLSEFEFPFLVNFGVSCSAANLSNEIPGTMYGFRIEWNDS